MDIENLRKIQETEKALRIHNINISTGEAVHSAYEVNVGGTRVPTMQEFEDMPSTKLLHEKEAAYQQTLTKKEAPMDNQIVQQLKSQIEEQASLIDKQAHMISQLQSVVNEIIREINKMQNSVPTKNPSERQQVLKAEDKTQHPRSGGYTPNDVAVEKFFNFSGTR